jgi:dTDP-4-amino-4,6-dideoxygalactose transaminase
MSIFNSVGSNYGWADALRSLITSNSSQHSEKLIDTLSTHYDGQAHLFYKGREAIQAALVLADVPAGSKVAITGFTCFAVYQAVKDAGLEPVFIDVTKGEVNFGLKELKAAFKEHTDIKAVIIQNTLGIASDGIKIAEFAREQKAVVIEDLAHCYGISYANGQEAGTLGDFVALSFSQDKMIDGVTGGALLVRAKTHKELDLPMVAIPFTQQLRDRFYPLLTNLVRGLYGIQIGKVLHHIFKKLKVLSPPVDGVFGTYRKLPGWNAAMTLRSIQKHQQVANHRSQITKIYQEELGNDMTKIGSSLLRFPVLVKDRKMVMAELGKAGWHITDTWYDVPIAPVRYFSQTSYQTGQCPNSEAICSQLINLPTHRYVTPELARTIARKVVACNK